MHNLLIVQFKEEQNFNWRDNRLFIKGLFNLLDPINYILQGDTILSKKNHKVRITIFPKSSFIHSVEAQYVTSTLHNLIIDYQCK